VMDRFAVEAWADDGVDVKIFSSSKHALVALFLSSRLSTTPMADRTVFEAIRIWRAYSLDNWRAG
jgi:hypothetical protein